MIVPFPLAECHAPVIARVWSGRLELPDPHQMSEWPDGIIRERGAGRSFHALTSPLDLEYMKEMYVWCHKTKQPVSWVEITRGGNAEIMDCTSVLVANDSSEQQKGA